MRLGDEEAPLWKKSNLLNLLRQQGKKVKKSLGQHYLIEPYYVEQIAVRARELATTLGRKVVEIGPGLGTLTQALLQKDLSVVAVELDEQSISILKKNFSRSIQENKLEIVHKDVLQWSGLEGEVGWSVIGNLPYNITSQILFKLTEDWSVVSGLVMMQKEVAQRLRAEAGSKTYGVLSVLVGYAFECKKSLQLSRDCFYPKPKVASEVVELVRIDRKKAELPIATDYLFFKKLVKAAFHNRRKKITNSVENYLQLESQGMKYEFNFRLFDACLLELGYSKNTRAEALRISQYVDLANLYLLKMS